MIANNLDFYHKELQAYRLLIKITAYSFTENKEFEKIRFNEIN